MTSGRQKQGSWWRCKRRDVPLTVPYDSFVTATGLDRKRLDALDELTWLRQAFEDGTAKRIRRRAKASQSDTARAANVNPAAVSLWEGLHRTPRGAEGLRYARVLRRLERQTR
jgi:DNA-binding transcriptional regulator YiaG